MFASEASAAKLLDMRQGDFRELVQAGHLPRPRRIGPHERWDVEELRRILRGEAVGGGDMSW